MQTSWEKLRAALEMEARVSKQSQGVINGLVQAYAQLEPSEREVVNGMLSEWLLSDDIAKRFDARVLVRRFQIEDARPALNELAAKLRNDPSTRARKELELILEIIAQLRGGLGGAKVN